MQGAFRSHSIERVARLIERAGVTDAETNATPGGVGVGLGDAEHRCGKVDTNDLTGIAEIDGERERSITPTAPDVEEPFPGDESQMFAFPRPQLPRCRPLRGRVHRADEHCDVRIIIHPLIAQPVCVVAFDALRLRQRYRQDLSDEHRMARSRRAHACQYRHMDAFETRTVTPADADAIAQYHHRCFTTTYAAQLLAGEFDSPGQASTRHELHDRFLPESDCDTRVVVVDDVPIGHVTVSANRLVHLFVDPDYQKQGLGRYLLELGEAMIIADGHTDFELHARVENVSAISFYERAGWVVTDRTIHTVEHGISYDERVLVKHHG